MLSVDYTSEDEEYEYVAEIEVKEQVNALASHGHRNKVFATLLVSGNQEKFQLHSGSTVNIMTDETVSKPCGQNGLNELEETPVTLVMYNQSKVKPLGKKRFKVVNSKNNKKYSIEFHLVRGESKSILGLRASEHLQLLTVNSPNILAVESRGVEQKTPKVKDYISQYTDVFTGGGSRASPPGDRQECPTSPATYTESPHCPQRASKMRTGQIVKYWRYWSDSEGRYTYELDFSTCGHNKEKWQS